MDKIERKLVKLSDSKKIDRLKRETNYYYIKILIISLQSDELKLQMLDKLYDEDKSFVIESLKSDSLKLDYIKNKEKNEYIRVDVIKSIKSDDLKMQALSLLNDNDYNKKNIIKTFESDEKKIEAMKKYINNPFYYRDIIETFSSDENKIANLDLLHTSYEKQKVLETVEFRSDEHRLEVASLLREDMLKGRIIRGITDYKLLMKGVELLNGDGYKVEVIMLLEEKDRIKFLETIETLAMQNSIINSITNEDIKIECLKNINDESLKCRVIMNLESDAQKLSELQQLELKDEFNLAMVISSLKSDETKLSQLENIKNISNIVFIQVSLKDREKLKEIFLDKNRTYSEIGLDPNMTIGIEIESEGTASSMIDALGKILSSQDGENVREWETEIDGSLKGGIEVKSPVLTDSKEDIEEIYMICSMLQKCKQRTNERCGGHIHIGADYLESKEEYVNLFEIWGNTEKIIFKMSNEIGTIPRSSLRTYATPISPKLSEAIENDTVNLENEEDLEQFIIKIKTVQETRYSSLNLLNVNNGMNTIEFRVPNGTINPDTWIENARLYGRIMQISKRLAEIEKKPEQSKEEKRLLELKSSLKDEIPEQDKMEALLELLFLEEREIYRRRYISSTKLLEKIPEKDGPFRRTEFSRVDFKKKKHNLAEFREVAVNDRMEATNEVARETVQGARTGNDLEQINDKDMEEK